MSSIFSMDSRFMRMMGRLGDLVILNLVFLVTCIPVFTIGAALTGLYTVCFRMGTQRERGVIRSYFQAFRENFKQGTVLWLILLLWGVCTLVDAGLFYPLSGGAHYLFLVFLLLFAVAVLVGSYIFPLLSQFDSGNKQMLKNALLLSVGYLPRSLLMAALNLFPFLCLWYSLMLFLETAFLWIFLYFAAAAYLNTRLLKKVFAPFMPEEEEEVL